MKTQIFLTFLFILAAGCSDSKSSGGGIPGAGLPELTDTQKQQVKRFNEVFDDVSVLTEDPNQQSDSGFGGMGFNTLSSSKNSPGNLTKAQQELVEKMDWAKQNNHCQVLNPNYVSKPDGLIISPQETIFVITGDQCPMTYKSKIKATPVESNTGYSVTINTSEKFVANPQGAVDLGLDILSFDSSSKSGMSFSASGGGMMGSNVNVNLAMNFSAQMTAQSVSLGQVVSSLVVRAGGNLQVNPQTGDTTSQKISLSVTATQAYQDFKVVAYMTASGAITGADTSELPANAKYYINGKSVSEQEFIAIFGGFDLNGEDLPL